MSKRLVRLGLILVSTLTISCHYFGNKEDKIFGKNFTISFFEPNYSLDWHRETNLPSQVMITNLMEGLVDYIEDEDGTTHEVAALALKWEANKTNTEWTFKLKPEMTWSDGVPLSSQHFLTSFKRLLSPDTKSPAADVLFDLKNAQEFNEGKITDFEQVGVKAPDDSTLIFTLNQPKPRFSQVLTHLSTYPMRQENIDLFRGKGGKVDDLPWIGAFKTTYISRRRVLLVENKKYRERYSGIKKVEVLLDIKKEKALKLMKERKVDLAFNIADNFVVKNLIQISAPAFDNIQLTFNCLIKPFNNAVARRVVGHSLNREELMHALPEMEPLGSVIPPGVKGFESNRGLKFDPDMATLVLKNSGMINEYKKYSFDLYVSDPSLTSLAAAVEDQLKKQLGMDLTIVNSKFNPESKKPSMTLEYIRGRNLDPSSYLSKFDRKSDKNISGWKNPNYDEFVRKQIFSQAQHLLLEREIPVVPLLSLSHGMMILGEVKGLRQNFLRFVDLKEITMERR